MKVRVIYFKPSGKYYTSHEGNPTRGTTFYEIVEKFKLLVDYPAGPLPGLSSETWDGPILIEIEGLPHVVRR